MAFEHDFSSKFTSENNIHLLKDLFFEMTPRGADKVNVLYTLKDKDHKGYPSLYRLYIEMEDTTEWEFANTYLDGWDHWQKLLRCKWFQPYVERWRHELELKLKARHLRYVKDAALGDGKDKLAANKYLLDKGYTIQQEGAKRGRPSKAEIAKKTEEEMEFEKLVKADLDRMKDLVH